MHMHVRNTLTRRCAILHRYVEGFGGVEACESLLDSGDGLEEVGELGWGEVG
jgi:hypothetical protein